VDPVAAAVTLYSQGFFPMDDAEEPELPWYSADPRAVLELDEGGRAATRRAARRSLAKDPGWRLRLDTAYDPVLRGCADRPDTWITPRLGDLYRRLHDAGWGHSLELWDGDRLVAGILAVALGRAWMLESMYHLVPDAGNVLLVRAVDALAANGATLCDVQLATDHTRRMGVVEISRREYEERLAVALAS
jgi:leucyl/phenylalanyl-tRNA--protein transferase